MRRVRFSRALGRWLTGRDVMICSAAEIYRWRCRHLLNAAFFWHSGNHCRRCLDYEMRQERGEGGYVEDCRRRGLL